MPFFGNKYILLQILITTHRLKVCVQVWADRALIGLLWCILIDLLNTFKPQIRHIHYIIFSILFRYINKDKYAIKLLLVSFLSFFFLCITNINTFKLSNDYRKLNSNRKTRLHQTINKIEKNYQFY